MKKYVLSLPYAILWGFTISFIFMCVHEFWLQYVQFHIVINGLLAIFRGLCFAFVTATVFYFVTVHYSKIKDRDKTYPTVVEQIDTMLMYIHHNCVDNLKKLWGKPFRNRYPTLKEWDEFTNVDYPHTDWDGAMVLLADYVSKRVQHIFMTTPNLDIKTHNLLSKLENCRLFQIATRTSDKKGCFYLYAPLIREFLNQCEELENYRKTELERYKWPPFNIEVNPNTPNPKAEETMKQILEKNKES